MSSTRQKKIILLAALSVFTFEAAHALTLKQNNAIRDARVGKADWAAFAVDTNDLYTDALDKEGSKEQIKGALDKAYTAWAAARQRRRDRLREMMRGVASGRAALAGDAALAGKFPGWDFAGDPERTVKSAIALSDLSKDSGRAGTAERYDVADLAHREAAVRALMAKDRVREATIKDLFDAARVGPTVDAVVADGDVGAGAIVEMRRIAVNDANRAATLGAIPVGEVQAKALADDLAGTVTAAHGADAAATAKAVADAVQAADDAAAKAVVDQLTDNSPRILAYINATYGGGAPDYMQQGDRVANAGAIATGAHNHGDDAAADAVAAALVAAPNTRLKDALARNADVVASSGVQKQCVAPNTFAQFIRAVRDDAVIAAMTPEARRAAVRAAIAANDLGDFVVDGDMPA